MTELTIDERFAVSVEIIAYFELRYDELLDDDKETLEERKITGPLLASVFGKIWDGSLMYLKNDLIDNKKLSNEYKELLDMSGLTPALNEEIEFKKTKYAWNTNPL